MIIVLCADLEWPSETALLGVGESRDATVVKVVSRSDCGCPGLTLICRQDKPAAICRE